MKEARRFLVRAIANYVDARCSLSGDSRFIGLRVAGMGLGVNALG